MRKLLIQLICGLFLNVIAHSQQLSPSLISAAGTISKAPGMTLEWTLGEIAIETVSATDRLYTQGFHQPLLLAKVFHINTGQVVKGFQMLVAPNPVQSVLTAKVNTTLGEKVFLTLIDFTGRRYSTQVTSGVSSIVRIDMSGMISGMYLLEARNTGGQLIQSFKIIKAE